MDFLIALLAKLNTAGIIIIVLIIAVFMAAFIINIVIRSRYMSLQKDLDDRHQRKTGLFTIDLLNKIVEDYKNTAIDNYSEVNTQAIIEKIFNLRLPGLILGERFVKHSISILITLGLLGTFLGLTLSVGKLAEMFDITKNAEILENIVNIVESLAYAISAMSVAFITSLFGIACSILLTLVYIVINSEEARQSLMVNIEEYLDNSVSIVVAKDKETEYTLMNKILRNTFIEFGERIEKTLKSTVEAYGDKLSHVVLDVNLSSKALDATIDKFDNSLRTFADNIRDFSEFNQNLKNNIERMDVNFIKVTEALQNTSKIIVDNYSSIEDFTSGIKESANEMTMYNRQVINDIGGLIREVEVSVSSIRQLGEVLRTDMDARTGEIRSYQEKFSLLMSKLSDEIDELGSKAAQAFSLSLSDNRSILSAKVAEGMKDVLNEVFVLLDSFKENEKIFAKTIAMLPDQALTYNEAAVSRIDTQLDEIKGILKKDQ